MRPIMPLGLRGTGRTVLLDEIGRNAERAGLLVSKVDSSEGESLARSICPEMRKVSRPLSRVEAARNLAVRGTRGLRSFASMFKVEVAGIDVDIEPDPGVADTGDLRYEMPDLFTLIGKAAATAKRGWLLSIDEVQHPSEPDLSALIVSLHRMS